MIFVWKILSEDYSGQYWLLFRVNKWLIEKPVTTFIYTGIQENSLSFTDGMVFFLIFRVSSKSNYFLSELSFAPTQEMVDCKPLNLYVLPSFKEVAAKESGDWLPASSCPDSEFQYRTVTEVPITDTGNESSVLETKSGQQHEIGGKSCCESDLSATTAAAIPKCSRNVAGSAHKISDASRKSVNRTCSQTNEKSLQNSISKEVGEILQGRSDRFILDIDLDFFSTTDPLQAMLTPSQQKLFRALYQYTSPIDNSDEVWTVADFGI